MQPSLNWNRIGWLNCTCVCCALGLPSSILTYNVILLADVQSPRRLFRRWAARLSLCILCLWSQKFCLLTFRVHTISKDMKMEGTFLNTYTICGTRTLQEAGQNRRATQRKKKKHSDVQKSAEVSFKDQERCCQLTRLQGNGSLSYLSRGTRSDLVFWAFPWAPGLPRCFSCTCTVLPVCNACLSPQNETPPRPIFQLANSRLSTPPLLSFRG